uniref:SAM domain-containing protein n=1 Tax=Elaeophora elaphi TaxID=1147741 RepID=A0A0R3S2J0_9BILA
MSEEERVHEAAEGISKGTRLATQNKISSDQVEEQIQVDRKRLESMITGEPLYGSEKFLPSAEEFFRKVTELSGAVISWPSRLKIGAKTKKDPYVKMLGTIEQVNCARQLIASTLRIKRDKISLRIEIPHCDHSKIIGRKGKNTQDIMRDTMCHIHFPDSNRIHDMEKNNQVSVSGTVRQVEKARQRLRKLSPLCIICELPNTCRYSFQELQRNIGHPDIFVSLREERNGKMKCILKGIEQNEVEMVKAVMILANMYQLQNDYGLLCHTVINAHNCLEPLLRDEAKKEEMQWLAQQTSTHIIQSSTAENGFELFIVGPIAGILIARKYVIGLLPVAIQFDRILESDYDLIDKALIETKFGVSINEKWRKSRAVNNATLVVLSSSEMNICMLYQARERILNLVQNSLNTVPDIFEFFKNGHISALIENMRIEAQNLLTGANIETLYIATQNSLQKPTFGNYEGQCRLAEALVDVPTSDVNRYAQITPNPDDSPIAHSLLAGIKQIDMFRNGNERFATREQLLLKANRAVYNGTPPKVRQPTDLWAGYGFSNSLPADILRSSLNFFDSTANQYDGRPNTQKETNLMESAAHRSITPSVGLASVLEEDEHGDDAQDSSNSNSLIGSLSSHNLHLFQSNQLQGPITSVGTNFSASTGVFESSPLIGNDFVWDIRIFVDPAMVLAQLGCSEYLAQFRDQEIDMEAFLLLDEQNLKDIGVSTMGARKKIYNAILRLRGSARMYGMRI